jgi:hypothetical protein
MTRLECTDCGAIQRHEADCRHAGAVKSEQCEWVEYVPATTHRGAVERAEKAEAELAKVEAVLVAADRVREAYDAMLAGRTLGRLPDFGGQ